jgi:transposase
MYGDESHPTEIVRYVQAYTRVNGFSPTYREIGKYVGISVATVHYWVHVLIENGELTMIKGGARTLRAKSDSVLNEGVPWGYGT